MFLIKKNNILEFYSWCECDYSIYLQISTKTSRWIGSCDNINIEDGDPENINFMFGGNKAVDDDEPSQAQEQIRQIQE